MDSSNDKLLNNAVSQWENVHGIHSQPTQVIDLVPAHRQNFLLNQDIYSQPTQVMDINPANRPPDPRSLDVLSRHFGHHQFRPFQWQIISSMLNKKQDNFAIRATGYGNSLLYQFPALYSRGTTLVISPLISLMQDQVLSLSVANISACLLGSAQAHPAATIEGILNNDYSIVYFTPEFCWLRKQLYEIKKRCRLVLIDVDEAYCVSNWGQHFRPEFRKLSILKEIFVDVDVLAVTATATKNVYEDIISVLELQNSQVICPDFDRPNLYFKVRPKCQSVLRDLQEVMIRKDGQWMFEGPTIIYCIRRIDTEEICSLLNKNNFKSLPYHTGLSLSVRKHAHEQFVIDKVPIIVATIAFEMGIDKPDVRNVIHYGTSGSLEAYYQEYFEDRAPNLGFRYDCCDNCYVPQNIDSWTSFVVPAINADDQLSQLLIQERSRLASINGCMPYLVVSDNILTSIVRYAPRTIVELRELGIEGFTEARMSKFMPQFLRFINNIDDNAINQCNFEIGEERIFEMEQDNDYEYYYDDDDNADDYYDDNNDAIFETEIPLMEGNFDDVLVNDDKNEILMALCDKIEQEPDEKIVPKIKKMRQTTLEERNIKCSYNLNGS
ncbi:unnamed protein product [Ceutorhynchus assimilis]|uniref:DNA 3'-5' helicase n=1 Tax=Ceutorhynchus assimilis TaxID=467358 RepID=A0A9N9MWL3_9CUCU|nr:unnamed protein product [Ceutorhynchus assimilis]